MCPEVTGFSDENAEIIEARCLKNSLTFELALFESPLWAFEIPEQEILLDTDRKILLTHFYFIVFHHHCHGEDPCSPAVFLG